MSEVQVFQNEEFGSVRTMLIDNEPWFVGKDVAAALGYKVTKDAIKAHVDDEDKKLLKGGDLPPLNLDLRISNRGMYIINESGMYSLILSSKLDSAKRFKRWVTHDVLPEIRKTGSYELKKQEKLPAVVETEIAEQDQRGTTRDDYLRAAAMIASCRNERLPYVLDLIRKCGIPVLERTPKFDTAAANSGETRDVEGECARMINIAINEYGMTMKGIGRLVGLEGVQIGRIRNGSSIPKLQRAKAICDAIRREIPDIDGAEI